MKIRTFLALMIIAALAPVLLFSTLPLSRLIHAEREAAVAAMKLSARATAIAVDGEWQQVIGLLRGLSLSDELEAGKLVQFGDKARSMAGDVSAYIVLYDASGQQLIDTALPAASALPDTRADALGRVTALLAGKRYAISDLMFGKIAQPHVVEIAVPLTLDNGARYLLGYGVDVADIGKALPPRSSAHGGDSFTIYDRQGLLLASNAGQAHATAGTPAPPLVMAALRAGQNGLINTGDGRYTMLSASSVSGWWVAMSTEAATIDGTARRTVLYSIAGLLLALLLSGAAALLFSKRVSEAIAKTGAAARAMGNGPRRLPLRSGIYEVDRLDQNVYLGAHLLASASAERERLLVEAQQARAVAESQNRSKDDFLAMLGHELRNPMAPITTAAQLMRMPHVRPDQVRQASDIITRQVGHMTYLLNDLLDVSRVTRGLIALQKKPLSLEAVLSAALEQTAAAMRSAGHACDTEIGPDSYWVRGDMTRLIQVLSNLLVNACRYSPPGSRITVVLARDGERIRLLVVDNGNGIDAELLPRIFELFSQGARNSDRATGGLGLGLALVRKLVELHGGSVQAFSEGAGKGSRFTVELPAADLRAGDAVAAAPGLMADN